MRTANQCMTKAAELRRLADACEAPALKADYLSMSRGWEDVAVEAAWQDSLASLALTVQ